MPSGYFKCKEGVEAYEAVGKPYDDTLDDIRYDKIIKQTRSSPHQSRNKKVVRNMVRLIADDGEEYIKYDLHETRYDTIGAWHEIYQPNVGTYPIPVTQPTIDYGPDGTARDVVNGPIVRIDTGYLIPFTKENVEKIHKMANDISHTGRTQYIAKKGGRRILLRSYSEFRDATFVEIESGLVPEAEKAKAQKIRD